MGMTWLAEASCRDVDTAVFFPAIEGPTAIAEARRVCAGCPVFDDCLAWTLDHFDDQPSGIFAGYSSHERAFFDMLLLPFYDWRQPQEAPPLVVRRQTWLGQRENFSLRQKEWKAKRAAQLAERPPCPNGHSVEDVYKYRKNARGQQQWACYICRAKMTEEDSVSA